MDTYQEIMKASIASQLAFQKALRRFCNVGLVCIGVMLLIWACPDKAHPAGISFFSMSPIQALVSNLPAQFSSLGINVPVPDIDGFIGIGGNASFTYGDDIWASFPSVCFALGCNSDGRLEPYEKSGTYATIVGTSGTFYGQVYTSNYVLSSLGYYGNNSTTEALFPRGLYTADGYGIGVGTTPATTNSIDFADCGTATGNPGAGLYRLACVGNIMHMRNAAVQADIQPKNVLATTAVYAATGYYGANSSTGALFPKGCNTTTGFGFGAGCAIPATDSFVGDSVFADYAYNQDDTGAMWLVKGLRSGGSGYGVGVGTPAPGYDSIEMKEITAPPNPPTDQVRIYVDGADGDYKIRFDNGVIRVLALN